MIKHYFAAIAIFLVCISMTVYGTSTSYWLWTEFIPKNNFNAFEGARWWWVAFLAGSLGVVLGGCALFFPFAYLDWIQDKLKEALTLDRVKKGSFKWQLVVLDDEDIVLAKHKQPLKPGMTWFRGPYDQPKILKVVELDHLLSTKGKK